MSEQSSPPKSDRLGGDEKQGPNPAPGGKIDTGDTPVPPYEGRTTADTANADSKASTERQLAETDAGRPGATASPAQESPVRPDQVTNDVPESPHHVGESAGRRGEDVRERDGQEPGREDTGQESAGRPTGTSTERDRSGT